MKLLLATHNRHKQAELLEVLRAELKDDVEVLTLDDLSTPIGDIPETGSTLEENASIKARTVFSITGTPTIADDTGLEVTALNGEPGVYSARYAGPNSSYADNVRKLIDAMSDVEDRTARFSTVICYIDRESEHHFRGEVVGYILSVERGTGGFGYDPLFVPTEDAKRRTFAEMPSDEKNAISHRGRALRKFAAHLKRNVNS